MQQRRSFSTSRVTKLASSPSTLVLMSCIRPSSLPEALLVTTQRPAKLFQRSETKPPLSPSQGSLQIDMQLVILIVLLIYLFKSHVLPWGFWVVPCMGNQHTSNLSSDEKQSGQVMTGRLQSHLYQFWLACCEWINTKGCLRPTLRSKH